MSDPTDSFSSDLDPYRLLAQMYGGGLFGSSASPSWSDYMRAQYMPDPSLAAALASDVPGFHKSPAVLEALAAADPRPPGFYRSPALLGASAVMPNFDPNLSSPSPSWDGYARAQYAPDPLLEAQTSNVPGFRKSPATDPRPPGFYRSPALLGASAMTPGVDPHLPSIIDPQAMLFGGPGLPPAPPPLSAGPTLLPRLDLTPVSFPPPLLPPATVTSPPGAQPLPVTPVNSPPTDVPKVTPAPATEPETSLTVGRSGAAPPVEPPSNSLELEQEFQKWPGQIVRLPNGLPVLDPKSPTGYLMSPFSDLSDVAAAGRHLGVGLAERVFDDPRKTKDYAKAYLNHYVGQVGAFDYQRRGYPFGKDGLTQLKQFRNVSNFNVGVITQQAGLPLIFVLWLAGKYAAEKSNNYKPDQPFGLDPPTREWIEEGYRASARGAFDSSRQP